MSAGFFVYVVYDKMICPNRGENKQIDGCILFLISMIFNESLKDFKIRLFQYKQEVNNNDFMNESQFPSMVNDEDIEA